ncbi:MAG: SpoIID/LytB domain-containing protein [Rikenellaceae bacterium]|jgi:SpoIID/LytB domain protein|nr:SpoIID/LytB domain-containing protein [Rikenellaceae bacterium]
MARQEPVISVGIVTASRIAVRFTGDFSEAASGGFVTGDAIFDTSDDTAAGREFFPVDSATGFFELCDVVIGKEFHWERRENQSFRGGLRIIREEGGLTAVNVVGIEEYLRSVISSEMSAASPPELLKAHAVISRSWLFAQLAEEEIKTTLPPETAGEMIRWFDREEHANFDVCADDHCQRYQGITRISNPAVDATRGEVLTAAGEICDARYGKCCGGATEAFEHVWATDPHAYLTRVIDAENPLAVPDLTQEAAARTWILARPDAFCHTSDPDTLRMVLNNYDQETPDFFRWQVEYAQSALSELIRRRTGIDFGLVSALEPIERGVSGRLVKLRIVGDRRTMVIGKELMIRRALSESHLYSSAFVVDVETRDTEPVFILRGAGWGHGVGLCQIGAAMMARRGKSYEEILAHYYPGAMRERIY